VAPKWRFSNPHWKGAAVSMTGLIKRRAVLKLMTLPLAGCAAEGARFAPGEMLPGKGSGIIYVYRPLTPLGKRGEDPFVAIARKSYGRMRSGSFISATFPEGEVDVTVQQSLLLLIPTIPKTITVTVVRGSQSYVRVDQVIDSFSGEGGGGSVMQTVEIEEVPPSIGQAELAESRKNI
jgi:hypothetical protein